MIPGKINHSFSSLSLLDLDLSLKNYLLLNKKDNIPYIFEVWQNTM